MNNNITLSFCLSRKFRIKRLLSKVATGNFIMCCIWVMVLFNYNKTYSSYILLYGLFIFVTTNLIFTRWYLSEKKSDQKFIISDGEQLYMPKSFGRIKKIPMASINEVQRRKLHLGENAIVGVKAGSKFVVYPALFSNNLEYDNFIEFIENIVIKNDPCKGEIHLRKELVESVKHPPWVTFILSAILISLFIIEKIYEQGDSLADRLMRSGGLNQESVALGEYWRLAASQVIHVNGLHLLSNIAVLCAFGNMLENLIGGQKFLIIFLVSGLMASIVSVIFADYYVSVGASGAIYGLIGAFAYIRYIYRKTLPVTTKILPGWILIFLLIVDTGVGVAFDNIDIFMHIGGFISGLIIMFSLNAVSSGNIIHLARPSKYIATTNSVLTILYLMSIMVHYFD